MVFHGTTATAEAQEAAPGNSPQVLNTVPSAGNPPDDAAKPKPANPFAEGMDLYRGEDYVGAFAKFTEVGDSKGQDAARAYAWAARAALNLKRPADAEANAKKALQLNPDLPTAQSAMGEVYFRQGKFAEAEQVYRKILLANIEDPRARLGLAKFYSASAYYKSAKALIDHAHQEDSRDPDIFWQWLTTLEPKEQLDALQARLVDDAPKDAKAKDKLQSALNVSEYLQKQPQRACRLTTKVESTETPLQRLAYDAKRMRGFGLLVKLNDNNTTLLVDTGASGITVSNKVAERAGLAKIGARDIGGFGDESPAHGYVAYAPKVQIGELQFENCYVNGVDRKRALDSDGLIGADVFEDFLVDLNFPDSKLVLSQLPPYPDEKSRAVGLRSGGTESPELHNRFIPPVYANFEQVYRIDHMILVPTRLNDGPSRHFLLDTGAWDNSVTTSAAREASKVHSDSYDRVKGLSGEVKKVYTTGNITLTFGKFQQKRDDLVAFDDHLSDDIGTEVSGTLGFAMLWMLDIRIDYRDNLVNFTYDSHRFH